MADFFITISFSSKREGNKVFQHFQFNKRTKNAKFIRDKRFIAYDIFERKIKELSLFGIPNVQFIHRYDYEDKITLEFSVPKDFEHDIKPMYFVVSTETPEYPGCSFCKHAVFEGNAIVCPIKSQTFLQPVKNCKVFSQKGPR